MDEARRSTRLALAAPAVMRHACPRRRTLAIKACDVARNRAGLSPSRTHQRTSRARGAPGRAGVRASPAQGCWRASGILRTRCGFDNTRADLSDRPAARLRGHRRLRALLSRGAPSLRALPASSPRAPSRTAVKLHGQSTSTARFLDRRDIVAGFAASTGNSRRRAIRHAAHSYGWCWFAADDHFDERMPLVVSANFARHHLGERPLGQRFVLRRFVHRSGVVGDVRDDDLRRTAEA